MPPPELPPPIPPTLREATRLATRRAITGKNIGLVVSAPTLVTGPFAIVAILTFPVVGAVLGGAAGTVEGVVRQYSTRKAAKRYINTHGQVAYDLAADNEKSVTVIANHVAETLKGERLFGNPENSVEQIVHSRKLRKLVGTLVRNQFANNDAIPLRTLNLEQRKELSDYIVSEMKAATREDGTPVVSSGYIVFTPDLDGQMPRELANKVATTIASCCETFHQAVAASRDAASERHPVRSPSPATPEREPSPRRRSSSAEETAPLIPPSYVATVDRTKVTFKPTPSRTHPF